jgi:large conductance mechanosensitive channel
MKGFKDFLMRGNLVELAVAFVIGAAFATVVKAFTEMFMDILGKLGGTPDFSNWAPGGVKVGAFITAVIAFVIVAFIIYFFVVKPYEALRERMKEEADDAADEPDAAVELLREIRDELRSPRT